MQLLRRPSTYVFLGAGLLAADPLRWLLAAWTDATLPGPVRGAAALVALAALAWGLASRGRRHRREVELLVLPPRASRRRDA